MSPFAGCTSPRTRRFCSGADTFRFANPETQVPTSCMAIRPLRSLTPAPWPFCRGALRAAAPTRLVWLPTDREMLHVGAASLAWGKKPSHGSAVQGCHGICKQLTLLYHGLEAALPPCTGTVSSCTRPQCWKTCDVVQIKHHSLKCKGSF